MKTLFPYKTKKDVSHVWRGIVWARKSLNLGVCFNISVGYSINPWTDPWIPSLNGFESSPNEGVDISHFRKVGTFNDFSSNDQNHRLVKQTFCEEFGAEILKILWPPITCEDKLIWLGNYRGNFSVKECYNFNICRKSSNLITNSLRKLWKLRIHEHLKLFLWRILANVIPTQEVIVEKVGKGDKDCPFCEAEVKTSLHIFNRCPWVQAIAFGSKCGYCLDWWEVNNIQEMIHASIKPSLFPCFKGMDPHFVIVFFSSLYYFVWFSRNHLIHQGGWTVEEAVESFEMQVFDFDDAGLENSQGLLNLTVASSSGENRQGWSLPSQAWLKINSDAACINGGSSFAFVVIDNKEDVIEMASKPSGHTSAFEAELAALAWAVEYAVEKNQSNVFWSLVAVEVVKEILSKDDPKGWSSRYTLLQVRSLFARFDWHISWNARSSSTLVGALAKLSPKNICSFLFYAFNPLPADFMSIIEVHKLEFLCNSPPSRRLFVL